MSGAGSCAACSGSRFRLLLEPIEPGERASIVRCVDCGHATVNPMPSAETIAAYYRGMYADRAHAFDPDQLARAKTSMDGYLAEMRRMGLPSSGDFLDLGGGLGYYARAAKEAGLRAILLDVDPVSLEFARRYHSLEVEEGEVLSYSARKPGRLFDIVFMRHVIEHFENPREAIAAAAGLLKPGGALVLETDNNRSVEMLLKPGTCSFYLDLYRRHYKDVSFLALLARRPFAVDPPRHLHGFSVENLGRILESSGVAPVKAFTYRLGDRVYWPNLPDATPTTIAAALMRLRLRGAMREMLDWMLIPLRRLLAASGRAAGICIYARKVA